MLKKYWLQIIILFLGVCLIFAYFQKDNLNKYISGKMQEQLTEELSVSVDEEIQRKYNYGKNGLEYDFTFLEFSSSGCAICKQMESVLEEIRNSEKANVNVVFLHIIKSENLDLMKYYGISAVPMQILLDKQGKEFFRHYGYISADDILEKAHTFLNQK